MQRSDVAVIVEGRDWDGEPELRAVAPGRSLCLVGKLGEGFDIRGPQVWMCPSCGGLEWSDRGDQEIMNIQRHYAREHGYTPALLP